MLIKRFLLPILLLLTVAPMLSAQASAPRLAFVNDAGQLVVAGADGQMRWIVTNPGESLHPTFGFTLSPDGEQIVVAISSGDIVSLRIGQITSMSIQEVAQLRGAVSGGGWTPDGGVIVSDGQSIARYSAQGSQVRISGAELGLISPYSDDRPHLNRGQALSPDGSTLFYQQAGTYMLQADASPVSLGLSNAPGLPSSGLWSDAALLVAYWGTNSRGTTALAVTNAASGMSVTLDSGGSAPLVPVAWEPGTTRLLYRDVTGLVRLADLSCLNSGCGDNPLENGQPVIPATGTDLQFSAGRVIYRDGDRLQMLDLSCSAAGTCMESAQTVASGLAPDTPIHGAGSLVAYSIISEDGSTPAVQIADMACQPDCPARTLLAGGVAGLLSADGGYLITQNFSDGLQVLHLNDLMPASLYQPADPLAAGIWARARWP